MNQLNFIWLWLAANPLLLLALVLLVRARWRPGFDQFTALAGRLVRASDWISEKLIEVVKWFAFAMVLLTGALVIGRYVFGVGSLKGQEAVIYMHGGLFLFAAAATLVHNGHVRVDVIFSKVSARGKAIIDILGSVFLLVPLCLMILIVSQSYVGLSWQVLEGSPESDGLQWVYLLKTAIPAFALLLLLQGSAQALRNSLYLVGHPLPDVQPDQELI